LKERSSDVIEQRLIKSILEGELTAGESLLAERELASHHQVGRPTIREVLQRLERDGWISTRKGMPAVVNDYWKHGNLMTIVRILSLYEEIPDPFIEHMLELRISLSPTYTKDAATSQPIKAISLFANLDELEDDEQSFAVFDWQLHKGLASLSPNPVYLLILNSFQDIYIHMGMKYFSVPAHRKESRAYYHLLLKSFLQNDVNETENLSRKMMAKSLELWKAKDNEE
jgi:GntR family negative regulator for fad regulon and positive regulator of fabA